MGLFWSTIKEIKIKYMFRFSLNQRYTQPGFRPLNCLVWGLLLCNCLARQLVYVLVAEHIGVELSSVLWGCAGSYQCVVSDNQTIFQQNTAQTIQQAQHIRADRLECPCWPLTPVHCRKFLKSAFDLGALEEGGLFWWITLSMNCSLCLQSQPKVATIIRSNC